MNNQPHDIDVHVFSGENGAVHVRTDENMDDVVNPQFAHITSELADVALAGEVEIEDSLERKTNADIEEAELHKMARDHYHGSGRPVRPSKLHK